MHGGAVIHWSARYDALVWLLALGRPRRMYARMLAPARLQPGEAVLDVGCGTGTLALVAREQVRGGDAAGVDASPKMIERARRKARKAGTTIHFETGYAQSLPFSDARFDVVVNTLMLHHLPRAEREIAVREMRRVLKPGGRLLAVDFVPSTERRSIIARLHHKGAGVSPKAIEDLVRNAGFSIAESGAVGVMGLQFVVAHAVT